MTALAFDARQFAPAVVPPDPDMLEAALALAALGLKVFPCQKGGKDPIGRLAPNGFKNATDDPATIRRWWSHGDWNIGVATDAVAVADFDPRSGGDASWRRLVAEHGPLPRTAICHSGGVDQGAHYYFQQPSGAPIGSPKSGMPLGVDIKGHGGYVIAPPSMHASGRRYRWDELDNPWTAPLAAMPPWLVAMCRKAVTGGASGSSRPADYFAQLVVSKVGEGARNDTVLRLVGHLLWTGKVSPHVALEFARMWNAGHCVPPMHDDEVIRIVDSVCGRELLKRRGR